MIKLIAVATFALAAATSAQAMPRLPEHQSEGLITHVREGCGAGRVRINGVCVNRRVGYYGAYRPNAYYGRPYRYYGGYRPNAYYGYRPYRPIVRGRVYRRWD